MNERRVYDLDEARNIIRKYCAYQERSHKEARERLRKMGLKSESVDLLISEIIEENYLNEERFAMAFVRGKFNIKGWGRSRLERELKMHQVSAYVLNKAMQQIDEEVYADKLESTFEKKWAEVKEPNVFKKGKKVADYLIRRGFESDRVWTLIRERVNE